MAVKLTFGEPSIVAMGPTYAEAGWGTHQFPAIRRLPDGRIACSYHIVQDTCEDYGKENGWAISDDDGRTWRAVTPEELPAVKARFGVRLPSGRYLRGITHRPWPISDELHAELTKKMGRRKFTLGAEEVPDLFPKTWTFAISGPDSLEEEVFDCELDYPGMTIGLAKGTIIRPMPFGPLRVAPDGSVWLPYYCHGRNPENLGYTSYYACYFFQSTDEGRSFHLKSWIQYLPDTNEFKDAFTTEGFCEPDICWQPDGSMLCLMRTGSFTPSYLARSTDGGLTWSKPVMFDRCGVLPQLQPLACGVTIATYGRPGLFARATADPAGLEWDPPYELMEYIDHFERNWEHSCYYTRMIPMDDRTALMAYSDFGVPDEKGVPRKTILVRTIHVEE